LHALVTISCGLNHGFLTGGTYTSKGTNSNFWVSDRPTITGNFIFIMHYTWKVYKCNAFCI